MPRKMYDKIIVIDVEATCWETNKPPEGQESEIIEVGICLLDFESHTLSLPPSIIVKPVRSIVSEFCTQLTTLTQEDVDKGMPFKEACRILMEQFLSKKRYWASWGDYDRRQFERQCIVEDIVYPFGKTHFNLKAMFMLLRGLKKEVGVQKALRILNMEFIGTPHRGGDDAYNIAKIMLEMLK